MRLWMFYLSVFCGSLAALPASALEKTLFEDQFEGQLSDRWQVVGLKREDYRIRDGALELRVHPGKETKETPMLKVLLPFDATGVTASVEVSPVDEFTEEGEFAGMALVDEKSREFRVSKTRLDRRLVFKPGEYEFRGKGGEEGDPENYSVTYFPALKKSGPLRIIVDHQYAYFQVGPTADKKYMNFFHSAIRTKTKERGFALYAAGAPEGAPHWVRFDNFKVVTND